MKIFIGIFILLNSVLLSPAVTAQEEEISETKLLRILSELDVNIKTLKAEEGTYQFVKDSFVEAKSKAEEVQDTTVLQERVDSAKTSLSRLKENRASITKSNNPELQAFARELESIVDLVWQYTRVPRVDFDEDNLTLSEKRTLKKVNLRARPIWELLTLDAEVNPQTGVDIRVDGRSATFVKEDGLFIDEDLLTGFLESITPQLIELERRKNVDYLDGALREIESILVSTQRELEVISEDYEQIALALEKKKQKQGKIDSLIIQYVMPGLAFLIIALIIAPKIYSGNEIPKLFFNGLMLEILTVLLLTSTILILGIGGRIDPQVLGTLLGGISGYVLGRNKADGNPVELTGANSA